MTDDALFHPDGPESRNRHAAAFESQLEAMVGTFGWRVVCRNADVVIKNGEPSRGIDLLPLSCGGLLLLALGPCAPGVQASLPRLHRRPHRGSRSRLVRARAVVHRGSRAQVFVGATR